MPLWYPTLSICIPTTIHIPTLKHSYNTPPLIQFIVRIIKIVLIQRYFINLPKRYIFNQKLKRHVLSIFSIRIVYKYAIMIDYPINPLESPIRLQFHEIYSLKVYYHLKYTIMVYHY